MDSYKQEIKEKSREIIWKHAIHSLTDNRNNSRILDSDYMLKLWNYSFNDYILKYGFAVDCNKSILIDWLSFSEIIYQNKNAEDLRVAFFCGPEPENDVKHLLDLGVRIENIYAFEYDKTIFKEAVKSLQGLYPQLKIYNGKIDNFIELRSISFDIVYLDFTKSLITEFKTVCKLFDYNVLTELSILITNTSYPDKTDENIKFLANYFMYQPCFEYGVLNGTEDGESNVGRFIESCSSYGIAELSELEKIINKNFEEAYSAFQTHFIISYSSQIKPTHSILNNSILQKRIFSMDKDLLLDKKKEFLNTDSVIFEPENHPFLLFSMLVNQKDWIDFLNKGSKTRFSINESIGLFHTFMNAPYDNFLDILSSPLKEALPRINENLIGAKAGLFCDIPMIHLWLELAINQLGYPYHQNTKNHRRYSYKAKEHKMCLDIFTLDRCRALYDWLPMIEYYGNDLSIAERQIISRMCMDAIGKHSIWILYKQYFGSALIGVNEREWSDNYSFMDRTNLD